MVKYMHMTYTNFNVKFILNPKHLQTHQIRTLIRLFTLISFGPIFNWKTLIFFFLIFFRLFLQFYFSCRHDFFHENFLTTHNAVLSLADLKHQIICLMHGSHWHSSERYSSTFQWIIKKIMITMGHIQFWEHPIGWIYRLEKKNGIHHQSTNTKM